MADKKNQAVILIPALEPDKRLPDYVDRLQAGGFRYVVIVDDGSSEKAQPIFGNLERRADVTVLHHDVNHGKGVALKTGYKWIAEHLPDITGVITADSDGQHTVEDCLHLEEVLRTGEDVLYLGSRDFNAPNIPPKSRKGNKLTSAVFKALYGQYLPDTQTGLRAFRKSRLQFMTDVKGERYEYEMNVLIDCAHAGIRMVPITIQTIYENNNEGTHFHPIRDSYRIYKVILGGFVRFMAASLLSWVVDQGLSNILYYALHLGATVSPAIARVVSGIFNYVINRKHVFKSSQKVIDTAWRYAVLWLGILACSVGLTTLLTNLGGAFWLVKMLVDIVLYLVSYRVQDKWVFGRERKSK